MNARTQNLTQESLGTILKRLKLKDLSQVFSLHSRVSLSASVTRDRIKLYQDNIRGSVRLRTGRFYTHEEWLDRKKRVASITLP